MDGNDKIKPWNEETLQNEFIKAETTCCLCAGPLQSLHQVDYQTLQIHETLDCPACDVTLKNTTHTLH